jgi:hypothetical protein
LLKDTFGLLGSCMPAVGVVALATWFATLLLDQGVRVAFEGLLSQGSRFPPGFSLAMRGVGILVRSATAAGFIRWLADELLQEERPTRERVLKAVLAGAVLLTLQKLLFLGAAGFAALLFIIPGLYLANSMALGPAAMVIDGHGPLAALQRSAAVVEGRWWPLFLALAPLVALSWVARRLTRGLSLYLEDVVDGGRLAGLAFGTAMTTTADCLLDIAIVLAYLRLTRRPAPEPPPAPVPDAPAGAGA